MNELESFLNLPDVDNIIEEVELPRLGKFKVKAMSELEYREYQNKCKSKIKKGGMDFDTAKFNLLIVAGQIVEPNFNSAEFLKKAGISTATEFIQRKFKAGEIAELGNKIVEISGFDTDINEDKEEAKN